MKIARSIAAALATLLVAGAANAFTLSLSNPGSVSLGQTFAVSVGFQPEPTDTLDQLASAQIALNFDNTALELVIPASNSDFLGSFISTDFAVTDAVLPGDPLGQPDQVSLLAELGLLATGPSGGGELFKFNFRMRNDPALEGTGPFFFSANAILGFNMPDPGSSSDRLAARGAVDVQRNTVPEPEGLVLLGIALVAAGAATLRRGHRPTRRT
ncbi:MAG: PEP-CTERM sorting domain-containing protein [Betaproteobacteria bacterium]|nr:PEP-CTERM sorting domain-containing protein [Betaproteobacteria bacterium]